MWVGGFLAAARGGWSTGGIGSAAGGRMTKLAGLQIKRGWRILLELTQDNSHTPNAASPPSRQRNTANPRKSGNLPSRNTSYVRLACVERPGHKSQAERSPAAYPAAAPEGVRIPPTREPASSASPATHRSRRAHSPTYRPPPPRSEPRAPVRLGHSFHGGVDRIPGGFVGGF